MKKILGFFPGVIKEMKKMRWLEKKKLFTYSVATISFMLFFALFLYLIDNGIAFVRTLG